MRKILTILVIVLSATIAFAQNRTVTGTVTDQKGKPIASASVLFKGKKTGVSADVDGNFKISAKAGDVLVISAVNFSSKEVKVGAQATINISLDAKDALIDEVVVVAYGTQKKTNLTGSIATVKAADIENKPFTSVDKALQGSVAGLQSSSVSGAPGSATSIRIRGVGSLTASSEPTWVIDGVIAQTGDITSNTTTANALSSLNPDDIESITVLKDAAASAIYGSRAANGVILVTTKKGKAGKSALNFSAEFGNIDRAFKPTNKSLTTAQNQTLLEQGLINAGFATDIATADAIIVDPVNGFGLKPDVSTNWLDEVTRKGNQGQYNLSLSGGNEKTQFYASGGYFRQDGTTIATDFKRYNGSLSITHKASDRITFNAAISGSASVQQTPSSGGYFSNPVLSSFFLLPWYSPYNADGTLKYNDAEGQFPLNGGIYNPLVQAAYNSSTNKQATFRGNTSGEFKILDNLKFTSRYSAEYFDVQEDQYQNPFYGDGYGTNGYATGIYSRIFNWTWSNFLDFKQTINKAKDMYFDLKVGQESSQNKYYTLNAQGQAFPATLALQYLASAAKPTYAYSLPSEVTSTSYFAIGDINYKNKYVLSGSFRRDGSSVFGANFPYGNFYSVGGTWNISEEAFLQKIKTISYLKLRSSYGENGNSNGFGRYSSLPTYGYGYNYTGAPGSAPSNVGNPNLTWEKNDAFNVGLDFGLFKNRLFGTVEYYNRKTTGLIAPVTLSPTSGFTGQNANVASMVNKGIEVTLGGKPIVTKNFTWDVSFNLAHNTNKILSTYQDKPVAAGQFNYTVGYNAQTYYLRPWAGVDPANGDPLWYTNAGHTATTNDISKTSLMLDPAKTAAPKYFGSFSNTFTYKGFSLQAQLYYNFGNYVYDSWGSYQSTEGAYLGTFNQLTQELTAWQKPGDITNVPKIIYGGNKSSYRNSSRFLYKGDYIRLRDVQLSYNLPKATMQKLHISNIIVYVRGTNLFTFGNDKNVPFDPETGVNATANLEVFIPKTVTAGIKIGL